MLKSDYCTEKELVEFGFKKIGNNVLISKDARIYGQENISIGNNVRIDDYVTMSATNGFIEIHNNIHIARGCHFSGVYGIVIRDFAGISANSVIYSASDDYSGAFLTGQIIPPEYTSYSGGLVSIGRHVIIGACTTIIGPCNIGEGCSIGTMSLIMKDLIDWNIYAGIPARIIKKRNDSLLELEKKLIRERPEYG